MGKPEEIGGPAAIDRHHLTAVLGQIAVLAVTMKELCGPLHESARSGEAVSAVEALIEKVGFLADRELSELGSTTVVGGYEEWLKVGL